MNFHAWKSLALAAATTPALAQTPSSSFSPVLFGVLDVNLRALKNGIARLFRCEGTDGLTSSRIGFRGTEGIGDGLKAGFWLEAPLAADTGTGDATRFWLDGVSPHRDRRRLEGRLCHPAADHANNARLDPKRAGTSDGLSGVIADENGPASISSTARPRRRDRKQGDHDRERR